MKYAADFRLQARQALAGKWVIAVIAGLIAALLGGTSSEPIIEFKFENGESMISFADQTIISTSGGISPEIEMLLAGTITFAVIMALLWAAVMLVLGSVVGVGYARFNLDLVDLKQPELGSLFQYFSHWKNAVCAGLLQTVYIFLWSLLFVIPGIVAGYSYAMTSYILALHPELSASEAITRSKEMMRGNRWRLFCLQFSFIGWSILSALTLGIGELWLRPYRQAAMAAFYREISQPTAYTRRYDEEPWVNE